MLSENFAVRSDGRPLVSIIDEDGWASVADAEVAVLVVDSNSYSGTDGTRFSCTRYGNVIGSRGSVIPVFEQQSESGRVTSRGRSFRAWRSHLRPADRSRRAGPPSRNCARNVTNGWKVVRIVGGKARREGTYSWGLKRIKV